MYRHHQFSGDPHPGNCMLLDDGTHGVPRLRAVQADPASVAEFELRTQRLGIERRGDGAHRAAAPRPASSATRRYYADRASSSSSDDFTWWYTRDEEVQLDARGRDRDHHPDVRPALAALRQDAPRDAAAPTTSSAAALEMLTLAVMSQLRARQLAPDRARVDLRRRAGHRARRAPRPSSTPAAAARRSAATRSARARACSPRRARSCGRCVVAPRGLVSAERVRDWVDGYGAAGPLVFIAVSASLTVVLFPGPLLAAASGLLFGTALGTPVSIASATLGASIAFSLSRWWAHDAVVAARRSAAAGAARLARAPRLPIGALCAHRARACRTRSSTTRRA